MSVDWPLRSAASLARYVNGYPFKPEDHGDNGLPIIRIKQLNDPDATPDYYEGFIPSRFHIADGDLIFSWSGSLSVKAWDRGPALLNQHLFRVEPYPGVNKSWLRWALEEAIIGFSAHMHGSAMTHITQPMMREVGIPLPPLEEQRRIANYLDDQTTRIDRTIQLRQRQSSLLSELEVETIRLGIGGGLSGTPHYSGLEHWPVCSQTAEVRQLARVVTLQRGVDLADQARCTGPYPVVTSGGTVDHHVAYVVPTSGVVIGRYGSGGSTYWVDGPHWPHNTTLYVRDYHDNDKRWVYYLLRSFPYAALQARAAVPGINRNDMAPVLVPWLSPDQQVKAVAAIAGRLEVIERIGMAIRASLGTLAERRRSLIALAVTGELPQTRVSMETNPVAVALGGNPLSTADVNGSL